MPIQVARGKTGVLIPKKTNDSIGDKLEKANKLSPPTSNNSNTIRITGINHTVEGWRLEDCRLEKRGEMRSHCSLLTPDYICQRPQCEKSKSRPTSHFLYSKLLFGLQVHRLIEPSNRSIFNFFVMSLPPMNGNTVNVQLIQCTRHNKVHQIFNCLRIVIPSRSSRYYSGTCFRQGRKVT